MDENMTGKYNSTLFTFLVYVYLFHEYNNSYHSVFRRIKLIKFYKALKTVHGTLVL